MSMDQSQEHVRNKSKAVLKDYKTFVVFGGEIKQVKAEHLEIFSSMKRWHANGHTFPEDWKASFNRIKNGLDVRGKMNPPGDLKKFLKMKFASEDPKTKFSISEMLEFLNDDINRLYRLKLDERDVEVDEFNVDQIYQGMLPEDVTFYQKSFLPTALFLTYSQRHPNDERTALMNDIFTVGSGSKREDLAPEVTGLCSLCASEEGFPYLTEQDVEQFNRKVLEKQIGLNFHCSYEINDSDSRSDKSAIDTDMPSFWFNPFSSSDGSMSESSQNTDDVFSFADSFPCNLCPKQFTEADLLQFHKDCFHKYAPGTRVTFVEEGEDLISSFHCNQESGTSPNEASKIVPKESGASKRIKLDVKESAKHTKSNVQKSKKGVRKSLRFPE